MTSKQETNRQFILQLWNQGIRDAKEIHTITNISLSTIYDNINKLKKYNTNKHAGSKGRPKKITARASKALGQYIRRDSSISTRTLATKLSKIDVNVSHQTVGRYLATLGYKKALPLGTPMLTDAHKRKRVAWAREHLDDNWDNTFFSDETAFKLFRNTVERWYKGARPIRRIPKDQRKIFVWGGFCINGKSSLFCFSEIMDAKFYVNILREHTPEIEQLMEDEWRFQQDNDPKHTSRLAKAFLEETMPEVLDWPSNSPDLNPIENLWCIVKNNVEKRMPKNLDELRRYMINEWVDIPESTLINLIRSMRRRCELVIESNGERISY